MRRLYSVLLYAALPLIFLRLLWRSIREPAYRRRWQERCGFYSIDKTGGIWIHAVSVGEVQAAEPLVMALLNKFPQSPILVTTTTPTGAAHVQKVFGGLVSHSYFPLDLTPFWRHFLSSCRPELVLIMETEIWPNLLAECRVRQIPVILANARMSAKSANGYARFPTLTRKVLKDISWIGAQSRDDAARFVVMGCPSQRVVVTGSLKFDIRMAASILVEAAALRGQLGQNRPVWIAASTREGEEEKILAAHKKILFQIPSAILVLVPRHPERFEKVAYLCQRRGFSLVKRSENRGCSSAENIFLGDSMGELPLYLAASDAAFVGGSLVPLGGHNVLEAAVLGRPVAFGPHMFNFAEISKMLVSEGGGIEVTDEEALATLMVQWLSQDNTRAEIGARGRSIVERNSGAKERLMQLVIASMKERRDFLESGMAGITKPLKNH